MNTPAEIEPAIESALVRVARKLTEISSARTARKPGRAHRELLGETEMNSYVLRSLVRTAAFRVMRRAPLWLAHGEFYREKRR